MFVLGRSAVPVLIALVVGMASSVATASPQVPADWLTEAQEQIQASEYRFSAGQEEIVSAPNRAHDLRTVVTSRGIRVTSRTRGAEEAQDGFTLGLRLARVCRESSIHEIEAARLGVRENRAELWRPGLGEWYVNDSRGIEQGFKLEAPPVGGAAAGAPLVLEMEITGGLGAYPSEDGREVVFKTGRGAPVVRYADLRVSDATGREIPSRIALGPGILRIVIEDRAATYPLEVDPLLTSPAWTTEGNQAGANYGSSAATAGDVNGDGFSDILIAAELFDNGQTDEGKAFLYYGSASGPSSVPAWSAEGDQAGAHFARIVGPAGDVNGDGYDDLLIGAQLYDNGQTDEGAAFLWYGGAAGPGPNGTPANADWMAESDQADAQMFHPVRAGDVNGDGYGDVLIGAFQYSNGQFHEGAAFVWYGGASGLGPNGNPGNADWRAEIDSFNANFGHGVSTAGDVNGDGYDDVIIGAFGWSQLDEEGAAYAWYGGPTGLGANGTAANADWKSENDRPGDQRGHWVSTAGDVNGDGYADVIVGDLRYANGQTDEGRVLLFQGSASGLSTSAAWTAEIDVAGALFGGFLSTAGDVNGDGYADILVGAPNYTNGQTNEGAAFVWLGGPDGLGPNGTQANADWRTEPDQGFVYLGAGIGPAGDVNGDGYSDFLVGAPAFNNDQAGEGRAYLYYGSGDGVATAAAQTLTGSAGSRFGGAVASAGDVNGDGFSDVIIGAEQYDNGEVDEGRAIVYRGTATGLGLPLLSIEGDQAGARLGNSVASAGDVNGDGYGDVIVGAWNYTNGEAHEGRALLYHGSPSVMSTTPAWSAESNQADADFGYSVASAGDVNGDGYGDVVVSAAAYDDGQVDEGRAYLYLGAALGLSATPSWTAESDQANAYFGEVVGSAGDVNGDGYSDVLVSAFMFDHGEANEGRAFVYHGSALGLSPTPNWTAESDQADAQFGARCGTAGDVNGDGYSDVIVGAFWYTNPEPQEGRAYAYYGSPSGLSNVPNWIVESNLASSYLGVSAGTAGDVNGDGYGDVIVGAWSYTNGQSGEGAAFVYHGSASGLATSPAWTAEGNEVDASFGFAAAAAGDVNGDGFGDVIVGAYGASAEAGKASLFFGGGGDGLDRRPRQARADGSAPIDLLGVTATSSFRMRLLGRTPAGRGEVQMTYEVKPLGTPFSLVGLQTTSAEDTGSPGAGGSAFDGFDTLVSDLAVGPYRWRARLVSHNPLFPRSPWLDMPGNAASETDLRGCAGQTWYFDFDGDGYGAPGSAHLACSMPPGYVANGTDCDDTNGLRFPGNVEVCDGIDNDCNSIVDDGFAAPTGVPLVSALKLDPTTTRISWPSVPGATSYDVVVGDLILLESSRGDFSRATERCLGNGVRSPIDDSDVLPKGAGRWYLVRPNNCGTAGTYDSGYPSQTGSRDLEIRLSGVECP